MPKSWPQPGRMRMPCQTSWAASRPLVERRDCYIVVLIQPRREQCGLVSVAGQVGDQGLLLCHNVFRLSSLIRHHLLPQVGGRTDDPRLVSL